MRLNTRTFYTRISKVALIHVHEDTQEETRKTNRDSLSLSFCSLNQRKCWTKTIHNIKIKYHGISGVSFVHLISNIFSFANNM